jgi:hypothetical protein
MDDGVDRSLQALAEERGVSVNFLVNRALRKFVEWDSHGEKFGIVSLPSAFVERVMGKLSAEQARALGEWVGRNLLKEFLVFWFKEASAKTLLKGYPRLAAQYGHAFDYEEHVEGGRWTIVLKHHGGRNWSAYYEELLKAVLKAVVNREATVETTEGQVVARFTLT